ncbi:coiledcoil domain containing, partial [Perkinsus olseni]
KLPALPESMRSPRGNDDNNSTTPASASLGVVQRQLAVTTYNLELARRRVRTLVADIKKAETERRTAFTTAGQSRRSFAHVNGVSKLEDSLDRGLHKLSTLTTENDRVKERITRTRMERNNMARSLKAMKGELARTRKRLGDAAIDVDTQNRVSQRARQLTQVLKAEVETQREESYRLVGEIKGSLEHESRVQHKAHTSSIYGTSNTSSSILSSGGILADGEAHYSESTLQCRILKLALFNAIQRRHIQQHLAKQEVIEGAFRVIKQTTGISDVEEITRIFVELEKDNYSLLKYMNEVQEQILHLVQDNKALERSLGRQHRRRRTDIPSDTKASRRAVVLLASEISRSRQAVNDGNIRGHILSDLITYRIQPKAIEVLEQLRNLARLTILTSLNDGGRAPDRTIFGVLEEINEASGGQRLRYGPRRLPLLRRMSTAQVSGSRLLPPPRGKGVGVPAELPSAARVNADSDGEDPFVAQDHPLTQEQLRRHVVETATARKNGIARGWSFDVPHGKSREKGVTTRPAAAAVSPRRRRSLAPVKRSSTHGGAIHTEGCRQVLPERPKGRHGRRRHYRRFKTVEHEALEVGVSAPASEEIVGDKPDPPIASEEQEQVADVSHEEHRSPKERAVAALLAAYRAGELQPIAQRFASVKASSTVPPVDPFTKHYSDSSSFEASSDEDETFV